MIPEPSTASHALPVSPDECGTRAGILGLGMCVPERVVTNADIAAGIDTTDEWIVSRTGIRERRISDADTATSDLALSAARAALADAKMEPTSLDLVLCATTSGDYPWPSTACVVQNALGAGNAAAFDLSAACSGFCYGLAVASSMIESGLMRRILVIGADTLSKQVNWADRGTCILFGDGAGAAVLGPCPSDEGFVTSSLGADGSGLESIYIPGGGSRNPDTPASVAEHRNCIAMKGQEVYRFAVRIAPNIILRALERAGLTPSDVDLLVMHQANIRIIQAVAERLKIDMERVFVNVERYGNTSAASVAIALTEATQQGRLKRGMTVVTVGFGAGLTWAANVIRWNKD